jgi:hypothetical protein
VDRLKDVQPLHNGGDLRRPGSGYLILCPIDLRVSVIEGDQLIQAISTNTSSRVPACLRQRTGAVTRNDCFHRMRETATDRTCVGVIVKDPLCACVHDLLPNVQLFLNLDPEPIRCKVLQITTGTAIGR